MSSLAIIAACCTIGIASIGLIRWVRSHAVVIRIADPNKPVTGSSLSYIDFANGLDILVEEISTFNPNVLVGINRGGAIVGGCIAKKLNISYVNIAKVDLDIQIDTNKSVSLENLGSPDRIAIIDDLFRKGEHMRHAYNHIKHVYPVAEVRRYVLLRMRLSHSGPEKKTFVNSGVEFSAFSTSDSNVLPPWDA